MKSWVQSPAGWCTPVIICNCEFKAILGYTVILRPSRATRDPVSTCMQTSRFWCLDCGTQVLFLLCGAGPKKDLINTFTILWRINIQPVLEFSKHPKIASGVPFRSSWTTGSPWPLTGNHWPGTPGISSAKWPVQICTKIACSKYCQMLWDLKLVWDKR